MYTILTIFLVPIMAKLYGVNGAAVAYSLVGISSLVPIIIARRIVEFNLLEAVGKPFLSTVVMGGLLYLLSTNLNGNLINTVLCLGSSVWKNTCLMSPKCESRLSPVQIRPEAIY